MQEELILFVQKLQNMEELQLLLTQRFKKKDREYNRQKISEVDHYIEIFVDTDIEECEKRDVKGFNDYEIYEHELTKSYTITHLKILSKITFSF